MTATPPPPSPAEAAPRWPLLFFAIWIALPCGLVLAAPLPVLLDRFLPDDAFYYLNTARNLATRGFASFDGLHPTNGFQPLWFLLCVPVFLLFPDGGEFPLRLLLLTGAMLYAAASLALARTIQTRLGLFPAVLAVAVWLAATRRMATNGLESALLIFLLVHVLIAFWQIRAAATPPAARDMFRLGLLCALLFLARTDSVFLIAGVLAGLCAKTPRPALRDAAAFLAPLALLGGGYLLWNVMQTGHFMPVSGAAKRFHSLQALHAALTSGESAAAVYLRNFLWPLFDRNQPHVALGLLGPAVCFLFPALRKDSALALLRASWPFILGAWLSYGFYATYFFGEFTRTSWYYAPHALLAALTAACAAAWCAQRLDRFASGARVARSHAAALALMALFALRMTHTTFDAALRQPPAGWNYNLYLGALWARDHLPEDATIFSGSTGVLGYFSGRRCVNTDGLINSRDFLEQVLKPGRLPDYQRQWDYTIDAFSDDSLAAQYPGGAFVALPPALQAHPFSDGEHTRVLRVFRMPKP